MSKGYYYIPNKLITDIYDKSWQANSLKELGISPYARVGSLSSYIAKKAYSDNEPSFDVNLHPFTFVGPLDGPNLDPRT